MDIPEDVMKMARSVYMGLMTTCERWSEKDAAEDIPAIALAILAERERCAKVAGDLPVCKLVSTSAPGKGHDWSFAAGAMAQQGAIAAAIRRGDA